VDEHHDRVELYFLPRRSPELNPDEYLNNDLTGNVHAAACGGTMLVLGDPGRPKAWSSPAKPEGSVHGDSVGMHVSDAANGWRHIARVASARNTFASLIAAAYHTVGQAGGQMKKPYPLVEDVEKVESKDAAKLIAALDEALRGKDQRRAKFRWPHVIALARVTASAAAQPAPGVAEARKVLGL
jgi:hypothetical protein